MYPKFASPSVTSGLLNCGELVRLNDSPRSSRLKRSVIGIVLNTEKSSSKRPGPLIRFRPTLPNVRASGAAKLDCENHGSPSPTPCNIWRGATRFGVWPLLGACRPDPLYVKFRGEPVCTVKMPPTRQPPNTADVRPPEFSHFLPLPNGRSYR